MKSLLFRPVLVIPFIVGICTAVLLASSHTASAINLFGDVCKGSASSSAVCDSTGDQNPLTGTDGVILRVANIMAIISSIAAVFMIMLGGFYFVTAGGDSGKVSSAKKTIIYAVVGLIVIFLARSIVLFIVSRV